MSRSDSNPIIDDGAPTSTGGIIEAAALCDALDIVLHVEKRRSIDMHGWGDKCSDAKLICCSWKLTVMYVANNPVTLYFHLFEGSSPLIFGMDVRRYSDTCNRVQHTTITFTRPADTQEHKMYTYFATDAGENIRLRLEIVPHTASTHITMMSTHIDRCELNMAKRIHRFGHASTSDMQDLMSCTSFDPAKVEEVCHTVFIPVKYAPQRGARRANEKYRQHT